MIYKLVKRYVKDSFSPVFKHLHPSDLSMNTWIEAVTDYGLTLRQGYKYSTFTKANKKDCSVLIDWLPKKGFFDKILSYFSVFVFVHVKDIVLEDT